MDEFLKESGMSEFREKNLKKLCEFVERAANLLDLIEESEEDAHVKTACSRVANQLRTALKIEEGEARKCRGKG